MPLPSLSAKKHTFLRTKPDDIQAHEEVVPLVVHKKRRYWLKISLVLISLVALVLGGVAAVAWWYVSSFAHAAGTTEQELMAEFKSGWQGSLKNEDGQTNFLMLGIDEIAGQKEGSILTDTIIVANLNYDERKLSLISIPRDLWIDSLKTKINALYYYGEISGQTTGEALATSIVEEILGLPIHYTMVVRISTLEEVINTLGGVEVDVPVSFSDDKFPRSDIDISTATTEAELYETISFQQGITHMDGVTALKYIRSRHSPDLDTGTDGARNYRQQDLVGAIMARVGTKEVIQNPHILGNLYHLYTKEVRTDLSPAELISLLKINGRTMPTLNPISLPIKDNGNPGVIYHPKVSKHQQWVWEPIDGSWSEIAEYIKLHL